MFSELLLILFDKSDDEIEMLQGTALVCPQRRLDGAESRDCAVISGFQKCCLNLITNQLNVVVDYAFAREYDVLSNISFTRKPSIWTFNDS